MKDIKLCWGEFDSNPYPTIKFEKTINRLKNNYYIDLYFSDGFLKVQKNLNSIIYEKNIFKTSYISIFDYPKGKILVK
jgi:hypothetical protein